ncbi:hypothetical protein CH260_24220 [Rhodococcus sp. 05-2256-B2]|nr:hypothetical protein CH258_10450 [Rhodococcus sp. 05-2256-B4]OZD89847.1 hypothetical protein CH260_24220 [Rhodococcus sp. 05-2256-B2]OZD92165.1 hypothetical protein CH257_13770 [Rhodococcus sp. 05-2256-B3]OZD98870.1 hypothetical protein CH285_22225 [Rhodococcus sp. 05-2256-B1]
MALFFVGGVMFVAATVMKWNALFITSIFLCVFAGFAALISTWLSRQSRRIIALSGIINLLAGHIQRSRRRSGDVTDRS